MSKSIKIDVRGEDVWVDPDKVYESYERVAEVIRTRPASRAEVDSYDLVWDRAIEIVDAALTTPADVEALRRDYEWEGELVARAADSIRATEDALIAARKRYDEVAASYDYATRLYSKARVAVGEDPVEGY
jgi:hypothetical protein